MTIICMLLIIDCIRKKKNIIQIIIIILLFLINLRIMIPTNKAEMLTNNLDVLFVIDNTISMTANDYHNDTRLNGVKKDCKYIINQLKGARFSLITFNNTAKIVIPYTYDINMTTEAIEIIEPIDELYAKGSSLNTPIETILSSLKSSKKKKNKKRIIFFISDGEITDDSSLKSFTELAQYVDNGAIMGYGTTKGGYMKNTNKYTNTDGYIMDYSNYYDNKAISKINETNLKKIAKDIQVNYINMTSQDKINPQLKKIKELLNNKIEANEKYSYRDTYYIFIFPLFILLAIQFHQLRRKIL